MDLPKGSQIFLDAGYIEYNFEDFLKEAEIYLIIGRKKNSQPLDVPAIADYKQAMRKFIETTIGEVEKLFPKKIHTADLDGFLLTDSALCFCLSAQQSISSVINPSCELLNKRFV